MKTFEEMRTDTLSDDELLTEISLGKISSTVVVGRLLTQIRKLKDKEMGQIFRTLGILIYITSLQHKKEDVNSKRDKYKRKRIKTW